MTKPTEAFTLPYEAAESITIAYLKRQLGWMEEERDQAAITAACPLILAEAAGIAEALGRAKNDLLEVGNDYPGSSCQKWCTERAAAAWSVLKPWEHCPSTHCERAQECRSVNECSAERRTLNRVNSAALAGLIADTADHPEPDATALRNPNKMTKPTDPFTLPYEAAESITIAYIKRQLVWMEQERDRPPLFDEDTEELIKDITAVRRVVWWMTGEFEYDDAEDEA